MQKAIGALTSLSIGMPVMFVKLQNKKLSNNIPKKHKKQASWYDFA